MKTTDVWSRPFRLVLLVFLLVIMIVGLWYIRGILEPLIIAAFVAYLINPIINYFIAHSRMSRKVIVNLTYFISLALLIGVPATLSPLLFDEFKQLVSDLLDLYDQLIVFLQQPFAIPGIPINFGLMATRLAEFRAGFLASLPDQALKMVQVTSLGALWLLVILVTVYYFLAEWPRMREGFINSFPERYQPDLQELYKRLRSIWMNYLRGQLLLMLIVGVTFTIAWTVIGIPGALVLGITAGFLTLIPDVGPFIAAVMAIGVAWLEGSNWAWMPASSFAVAMIVLLVYLVLISVKNFLVRPFVMGRSVHMNEALVLISILLATVLWGILGALLIVPVLASLGIIFDYLRRRILGMEPFPEKEPFTQPMSSKISPEKMAEIRNKIMRKRKA
jgi:predicted PurR-regulated permease PerM